MIITRTPFRVSFFGGGTDYPAWYQDHIGMVMGASINKYCYIMLDYDPQYISHRYRVVYSQIEERQRVADIRHPAVRAVLQTFDSQPGIEILHASDLPARSGIGSSSAFVVGLLNALYASMGNPQQEERLAQMATMIEQDILREPVGSQDQILTAWGGFHQITWHPYAPAPCIRPLSIGKPLAKKLAERLMLVYTGARVDGTVPDGGGDQVEILRQLAHHAKTGTDLLLAGDLDSFGELLDETWESKKQLGPHISTPRIDALYQSARDAGAVGGKLMGSGGGGFMLLYAAPEQREAIMQAMDGCKLVPFEFEFEGTKHVG
jgi:D-glycero-alpha-D-manno-heptose-7-phosphate kinase